MERLKRMSSPTARDLREAKSGLRDAHLPKGFRASILALALGWVMIYADRLSISPLLDMIRSEFGLSYSLVSLVLSIYFLAYVAFTIPATIWASKAGYKKMMVSFFLLAAFSLAFAGVLGYSFALLVFFIGLHGAGAGAYYPTAYTISTGMIQKEKMGYFSSLINSGMGFGTILGLIVAGPVLLFFSNWQAVLIILSLPTAIVAYLLYRYPPDAAKSQTFRAKQYLEVLKNRDFVLICVAMYCSLYGYWVILSWAPTFLQNTLGLSVLSSGAATAIFAAVAIPSSVLISKKSDFQGRKRLATVILPLAALMIFFMAYSTNLWEFILAVAGYGIVGKLSLDPLAIAWTSEVITNENIGHALAVLNVVAMSSSVLAPFITGFLKDTTGSLASGFYLGAVLVLLGAFFLGFARSGSKPC